MPRLAANLSFLFTEVAFLDRFAAAAQAGFRGVEFLFPYDWPAATLRARLDAQGLEQVLFNLPPGDFAAGERGIAAIPGREAEFEAGVVTALTYARALSCKRLHAMAGLDSRGARRDTYLANLRRAADMAAADGVTILIEPINQRDMPGYHLSRTEDALGVIAAVGAPNLALQLDLYHRHIVEGGVEEAVARHAPRAGHIQIAAPPDRGEPDAGEIDYRRVLAAIDASGYQGWVGCEYKPRGETTAGLAWVTRCGLSLGP
jgi:hydroxypyruvate isomerase